MIETTYYNVEQMVPNSPEGVGVWGWTCNTHNDKMTDRRREGGMGEVPCWRAGARGRGF